MSAISRYRQQLPQLGNDIFLTDGGLETTLVFLQKVELPMFAAIGLLSTEKGRTVIWDYYRDYLQLANEKARHFILEAPTWRANPDWAEPLGYTLEELLQLNRDAVDMMVALRDKYAVKGNKVVISGCIGPRGDGYVADNAMTVEQARQYHGLQIQTIADSAADMVSAMTMNYLEEAIGITLAAQDADIPVVISFTTETNGRLPSGETLQQAITRVDAATNQGPVYYMINCAHPDHFRDALASNAPWVHRIRSIRANASRKSHQELDESTELDRGNPAEFGSLYAQLRQSFPQLTVLGGCCGTDLQHISSVEHHCCG